MREDWASVRIPLKMAEAIDKWLELPIAKKNGVFSRADLMSRILSNWFVNFEKDFGVFVPRDVRRTLRGFDVTKPFETD